MSWLYLFIAGLLESFWVIGLKSSNSFTNPIPSVFALVSIGLSLFLFAMASKTIAIDQAYIIWVALGVIGATTAEHFLNQTPFHWPKLIYLMLIIIGIAGLKFNAN
jgi:quaternary ammonium compound-resistance protein SugE